MARGPSGRGPSGVERLKESSRHLRGALAEELAAGGTQVTEDGYNLLKFHGSYEQFDRDTATARKQRGEEKEYSFMVRVRMPGGRLTAAQYLAFDALANDRANGTLRITTRQGVQFHGVVKGDLKPAIAEINDTLLTTMAACGDVVRNVMTSPAPVRDAVHARLDQDARLLSAALLPRSRAYHEIFLDEAPTDAPESEPLYGATYLPRKFKIGLAIPQDNTIDVLTNDLGFIAVFEGDTLIGYNLAVGGGLGMTHNRPDTYPRLASVIGSVGPDDLIAAAEAVIALQRDHGDRSDRKRARLKYVVDAHGVDWVRATLADRYGLDLRETLPTPPLAVPDLLGWHDQGDGRWWLGVPVPSGRIADTDTARLRTALREIMRDFAADPVMTPQQDVLLTNIAADERAAVEGVLRAHGVRLDADQTMLERWTLACPALPTCGLALTEAERVRPEIVGALDAVLARHGLSGERISLRITGCPNGCARTYAGDIGLVGRMPGHYAIYVGGDFEGTVLSEKLLDRVKQEDLAATFEPLFAAWAAERTPGEAFGAFCRRVGLETLRERAGTPATRAA
ncbi:NADPH-dependent assimilatory sulfite reductase hemoprotein subunit [Acidisphaera rubrifaciens]|uniref:NADPH-dependent assimilatory sulfite reductase hemoprotein subunit n=1 Tax=Acidisphaera rubrifaciens TaxID=50715 RepID=UPI0006623375|nr:NADPH-dependent assimilatory sulfite reductase hemoprotein subunit [Acidisphaera rubrifaciens]